MNHMHDTLPLPAPAELDQKLRATEAQLQMYARDFRRVLNAERAKTQQLEATNRQLERYARDLQSAFVGEQARCRELEKAHRGTLLRLLRAARFKDDETASHLRRLAHYCRLVAQHFWWSAEDAQRMVDASPMHDIGKIGVPGAILRQHGPLTAEEWRVMRRHPAYGALLLQRSGSPLLEMAREIALCHHERWDGSGYPRNLRGDALPIGARILAIADTDDALRCRRVYKPAYSHDHACDVILNGDGRTFPRTSTPRCCRLFAICTCNLRPPMPVSMRESAERRWRNLPLRLKGAAVIAIPIVCVLLEVAWLAHLHRAEEEAASWTLHTQRVQLEADRLLAALVDVETGNRGYALTGDPIFLEPYQRAVPTVGTTIENLRRLTA